MKVNKIQSKSKIYHTLYIFAFIFFTQTSSRIIINNENIKNFTKLEDTESERYLNYGYGIWLAFDQNAANNPDRRIFEFHSIEKGFLDYSRGQHITGQSFFSYAKVLVFYADRKPMITTTMATRIPYKKVKNENMGAEIAKYKSQNESILDYMNSFPYYKMYPAFAPNTSLLQDFPNKLRESSNDSNMFNVLKQYNIEINQKVTDELITSFSQLIYDLYVVLDERVFTDNKFLSNLRNNNPLWTKNFDAFHTAFKTLRKQITVGSEIFTMYKNLISEVHYFAHKCFRFYFFNDQNMFLRDLFNGYQDGVSTFSELFEKNINKNRGQTVLYSDLIEGIKPDYDFDIFYIDFKPDDDVSVINEKISKNFDVRMFRISYFLNKIMNFLHPILQPLFNMNQPTLGFKNIKYVTNLLYTYSYKLGNPLYSHYVPIVKEGLLKMPELASNNIADLDNPEQFKEFRKRLVILGYLRFDEDIDGKELFYQKYSAFKVVNNRMLLV